MWLWEVDKELTRPSNEHESSLIDDLRSLRRWFQEADRGWVLGYGQAWLPWAADPYPVVLVNTGSTPSEFGPRWVSPPFFGASLPQTKLPLFWMGSGVPAPSVSALGKHIDRLVSRSSAIYPAGSKRYGTAGVAIELPDGTLAIATAGHVFPGGVGQEAERLTGVWPLRKRMHLGRVLRHTMPSPTGGPGWDIAVILPDPSSTAVRRSVIRHPSARVGLEPAYTRGASSGLIDDIEIVAGLEEVRGIAGITWHACWFVGPTSALQGGDSGAPIFSQRDDKLLGIYVGHATNRVGAVTALFAQDAYSLQHHVLDGWGAAF